MILRMSRISLRLDFKRSMPTWRSSSTISEMFSPSMLMLILTMVFFPQDKDGGFHGVGLI